ncbi:MAG: hypothetical protein NTV18_01335 [Actinobacteria bacterium]|nr:hypothetical protein [Actinomycetota bacterium]
MIQYNSLDLYFDKNLELHFRHSPRLSVPVTAAGCIANEDTVAAASSAIVKTVSPGLPIPRKLNASFEPKAAVGKSKQAEREVIKSRLNILTLFLGAI